MKKHHLSVVLLFVASTVFSQTFFDTKSKIGQAKDENGNELLNPYILTPIPYSTLETLFKKFQNDGWIEFHYPQNGCQYRAHAMSRILLQNGLKSNKIWSFKPALLGENSTDELNIPDPNFEGSNIKWAYHVAPVVLVTLPNKKIDTMVVDPSMFDKPVSYKTWLNGLNCKKQYYTFVHGKYVQYATNSSNVLTGGWYSERYSVDMRWISTSICKGKISYMYITNEIIPLAKKIRELDLNINSSTSLKQKSGLEMEKKYLTKIYNDRKAIATNSDKFGELPKEYQAMLIDCQEYLMECIYFYWDNIESNSALEKCK